MALHPEFPESPYAVLLPVGAGFRLRKEGWDVRNVTTIVGLRAYVAQSNILPEQTLERGLRRMYFGSDIPETVSVMGTPAFYRLRRVHSKRGRDLRAGADGAGRKDSLVVEVDIENTDKNLHALDIELHRLTRRFNREFKDLDALVRGHSETPGRPGFETHRPQDFAGLLAGFSAYQAKL